MMRRLRCAVARLLVCLIVLVLPLSACSDGTGAVLAYDISAGISSLDPQYATSPDAKLVLRSAMEGLYARGEDGGIVPAAAQGLVFSDDKLTATVTLREGLAWTDGEESFPLTADDFVFALRRLFTPGFPSPYAVDFACIKNASAILAGALPPASLGVSAPNARTLVIELQYPVDDLPQLLASTAAIPCNRAFFEETRGRYGLDERSLLYNGPFYIRYWEKARYVQLRHNGHYADAQSVFPARLTFYIVPERAERLERFRAGRTDAAVLSYDEWSSLSSRRVTSERFEDTVWVLAFNQDDAFLAQEDARVGLARAIDHRAFAPNLDTDLVDTRAFLPPTLRVFGESYRRLAGFEGPDLYDPDLARELFSGTRTGPPQGFTLLAPDDGSHPLTAAAIQKCWREALGFNVNLRLLPREELVSAVQAGNYRAAILPLKPDSQSPAGLLGDFLSTSARNFVGYDSPAYDALLARGAASHTQTGQLAAYRAAEDMLLREAVVVPLTFQTHYYAAGSGVSGVAFSPFAGETSFKTVLKR